MVVGMDGKEIGGNNMSIESLNAEIIELLGNIKTSGAVNRTQEWAASILLNGNDIQRATDIERQKFFTYLNVIDRKVKKLESEQSNSGDETLLDKVSILNRDLEKLALVINETFLSESNAA